MKKHFSFPEHITTSFPADVTVNCYLFLENEHCSPSVTAATWYACADYCVV